MNFVQSVKIFFKFIFSIFYKIEVHGYENIPRDGDGYVLCANHSCWFDPILIGSYYPDVLYFMAKKELFESPILGFFIKKLNAFPVDRNGSDLSAIKTAIKILREEKILGIFPEGTRNMSGKARAKAGVSVIAIKAKKNVLPVAIIAKGKYRVFTRIIIVIGEMINLEEYYLTKKISKEKYQLISDNIMKNIYILKDSKFSENSK